jgi:RNA polymerase sigma factor (TIGR02999 family)
MPIEAQEEVARLLQEIAAANGNKDAERALFELVYDELKKMARCKMNIERKDHSLGATGVAHEAYVRLLKDQRVFGKNRQYFFAAAGDAMRQLLREYARARDARKRREHAWWARKHRPPASVDEDGIISEFADEVEDATGVDLFDLMEALDKLKTVGKHGKRWHEVICLHFWSGWTYREIAEHLGVHVVTVERDWQAAQAWLYGRLKGRSIDA